MKIIWDNIVFSLQKSGGISVVWYEMLHRFIKDVNLDYICIEYISNNIFRKKMRIDRKHIIFSKHFLFLKRYIPLLLFRHKNIFIFHSSYYRICLNRKAINITTVHDFTYEYFSHGLKRKIHCWQKYYAINKSDYIICISENTRRDLIKFLPNVEKNKIRVIYNGVSDDYYVLKDKNTNLECDRKFVLFVGSRVGYKKFDFIVDCLVNTSYDLVIVGNPLSAPETRLLNEKLGENHYKCLGRISNSELNKIYNKAFALLYPSLYEGFGIPILEAQKAGCPVIAYNNSSIPEIMGNSPLMIEQFDIKEVNRYLTLLEDSHEREMIIASGIENAKRFTWDKMYNQIISLYEEAYSLVINKNN